ncbi:hypothetical protein B0H16DRAFT_1807624 [Mycena metata]|uniref:Uncharacterized protein n=1 Tax=Mycena metata TaxID=1033252 RepID=A0AAD7H8M2_9AGAR|nr:hypothetical protein B0H16DRAFT_1807624 [Mycena metata]
MTMNHPTSAILVRTRKYCCFRKSRSRYIILIAVHLLFFASWTPDLRLDSTIVLVRAIHKSARDAEHARPHCEPVMLPDPFTDNDWHSVDMALQARPASCKAMLKFEPRQIGNIHIPAYESNVPKNHPPIDIFDAAIVPLTQLLISFPNDHPVFNSYNRFFTELAMRRCLGTDRIRVWNPHWWRKTWKSSGSALLERPLDILLDDASSDEWRHRVLSGTRILPLLSSIQLEQSLNLNGDIIEDLGQGYHSNFLRLPRGVARHRLREPDMERPPIPIDNLPGIEELSAKARFRPASELEDAPAHQEKPK